MSNEISIAPVIVNVTGATSKERKMSVIQAGASNAALLALISAKGDVGKYAREASSGLGLINISKAACTSNYRPLAEYLAMQLGEAVVISNRASFESLPDQFEQRILKCKTAKNGGYRIDSKTGTEVPTAAHALYLQLKAECEGVRAAVTEFHVARKAQEAKKDEEMKAITQG